MTRLYIRVHGQVQGVGYRWFVRQKAAELALTGWVRNLKDRTVELEVEGKSDIVSRFTEALKSGHPYAQVDRIETKAVAVKNTTTFEIR